jgi:uncharacterized protein (TIGR03435 family)
LSDREFHARMRAMLQNMLADRFHARIRKETREMPVYAIVVAKGGPKLKKSEIEENDCLVRLEEGCHDFDGGWGRGMHAKAVTTDDLAQHIENWSDHPVINRTGLDGLYAVETEGWTPMRQASPPTGDGDMTDPARPTLFQVMQKLGLELKQEKGSVDVYIIEHIERPTAN